mmetsp:Transcript_85018/g.259654  ORF Transcript_85018/g.259654 Transcript_85018/m.259654 type:complete len:206 (-) Transcript_85018:751-1368(-)
MSTRMRKRPGARGRQQALRDACVRFNYKTLTTILTRASFRYRLENTNTRSMRSPPMVTPPCLNIQCSWSKRLGMGSGRNSARAHCGLSRTTRLISVSLQGLAVVGRVEETTTLKQQDTNNIAMPSVTFGFRTPRLLAAMPSASLHLVMSWAKLCRNCSSWSLPMRSHQHVSASPWMLRGRTSGLHITMLARVPIPEDSGLHSMLP